MTSQPNRAKLTKGYVDRIKPGPKDEFHWDSDVKGFGVRVTPTGKLTFIVQGRIEGSGAAAARITIGPYGVFTVDQARDVAREHLRSMRLGVDPRQVKKADEAAKVTLQQVCDAYVSRPGKLKASSNAGLRQQSVGKPKLRRTSAALSRSAKPFTCLRARRNHSGGRAVHAHAGAPP